jgi:hypothetical protein
MMPAERERLAALAASFVGVPFVDRGREVATGMDCLGVVLALGAGAGRAVEVPPYGRQVDEAKLRAEVRRHLEPVAFGALELADVLTFEVVHREQHFAVVTGLDPVRFVHAYEPLGRVVEQPLDAKWRRRLRGCWRFPGAS